MLVYRYCQYLGRTSILVPQVESTLINTSIWLLSFFLCFPLLLLYYCLSAIELISLYCPIDRCIEGIRLWKEVSAEKHGIKLPKVQETHVFRLGVACQGHCRMGLSLHPKGRSSQRSSAWWSRFLTQGRDIVICRLQMSSPLRVGRLRAFIHQPGYSRASNNLTALLSHVLHLIVYVYLHVLFLPLRKGENPPRCSSSDCDVSSTACSNCPLIVCTSYFAVRNGSRSSTSYQLVISQQQL